jgi:hypothetical protein
MGGSKFYPKEPVVSRRMSVNGTPGVVTYLAGRPLYVLTIEIRDEHISSIYFVTNPDKLTQVPGLAVGILRFSETFPLVWER